MGLARVIGGVFGLESPAQGPLRTPPFLQGRCVLLANGRSALRLLVEQWRPGRVWLPSYLCPDILAALEGTSVEIAYYPVDEWLQLQSESVMSSIQRGDLVIVIDYFGFPAPRPVLRTLRDLGAMVVEDACQALLSAGVGQEADAVVFSPRKFLGVPDGGILKMTSSHPWTDPILQPPPTAWWLTAFAACLRRRDFDRHGGGDRTWFARFQEAERTQPVGPYRMSDLTRALLRGAVDYEAVIERRRANYAVLLEALRPWALRPDIPPEVVPMGFPMVSERRDTIRRRLFEAEIYPPIHWTLGPSVPAHFETSHRLSAQILTLPCDQRYDAEDMRRIAIRVRECL